MTFEHGPQGLTTPSFGFPQRNGAGRIRTCDLRISCPTLLPLELRHLLRYRGASALELSLSSDLPSSIPSRTSYGGWCLGIWAHVISASRGCLSACSLARRGLCILPTSPLGWRADHYSQWDSGIFSATCLGLSSQLCHFRLM